MAAGILPPSKPEQTNQRDSMKKLSKKHLSSLLVAAVALLLPVSGLAQTTIGSWQGSTDGWVDWNGGSPVSISTLPAKYNYTSGLQITQAGWNQGLSMQLQNNGYVNTFMNNHLLTFTFSVEAWTAGGYSELAELAINAQGYGFVGQAFDADWSATGDTSWNQGTKPHYDFWNGSPARSQTVTLNYSDVLLNPNLPANPGWVELIFAFNNGGGAPANFKISNVILSGGPVPEPTSMALFGIGAAGLLLARRRRN
jgi:hypothetical protein